MTTKTITLQIPDALYQRARAAAELSSRSIEDVLTQSIAVSLPPLEGDLPADFKEECASMVLFSDTKLRKIANSKMPKTQQKRLEELARVQKTRHLTEAEEAELQQLFKEAEKSMLRKAEALRLLSRRGYSLLA